MNRNETSRLQFTDAERGDPRLRKHIRRADKAADKLEKAKASIQSPGQYSQAEKTDKVQPAV